MNVFDLVASLTLDNTNYINALRDSGQQGELAAQNLENAGNKIKGAFKAVGKVAALAATAAGAAAIKMGKDALDAYAEYEQLLGGVETLFGTDNKTLEEYSADFIEKTTNMTKRATDEIGKYIKEGGGGIDAYLKDQAKAAGIDLNKKTKGVQEFVSKTMRNYSRLSEYYGLTTEDMAQTAKKNYADMEKAQALVVKNAEQGWKTAGISTNKYFEIVTGLSAALKQGAESNVEAAKNADMAIQDMADNANKMGTPLESVQAAFAGFAKNQYQLLDNLKLGYGGTKEEMERLLEDAQNFSGVKYDMNNLNDVYAAIHVIQQELGITGTTSEEAAKTIEGAANATKAAWQNVIISFGKGEGIGTALEGLATALFGDKKGEGLINQLVPRLKQVFESMGKFMEQAVPYIEEYLPPLIDDIIPAFSDAVVNLLSVIIDVLPGILDTATKIVWNVIDGIGDELAEKIPALSFIFDNLGVVIAGTVAALGTLKAMLAISSLINAVTTALTAMTGAEEGLTMAQLLLNAAQALNPIFIIVPIIMAVVAALIVLWNTNEDFRNAVIKIFNAIKEKATELFDGLKFLFTVAIPTAITFLKDKIVELYEGIKFLFEAIPQIIQLVKNAIAKKIWEIAEIITTKIGAVVDFFNDLKDKALTWGKDLIDNFVKGIKDKINKVKDVVKDVAKNVKDFLGFSEPKKGPLSNFHTYAPDMIDLFVKGIKDNEWKIDKQIASSFDIQPSISSNKETTFDYERFADVMVEAMKEVGIDIDGREIARINRRVGYGISGVL